MSTGLINLRVQDPGPDDVDPDPIESRPEPNESESIDLDMPEVSLIVEGNLGERDVEEEPQASGLIRLHLIGKHDQSSHGTGGGSGPSTGVGATGIARSSYFDDDDWDEADNFLRAQSVLSRADENGMDGMDDDIEYEAHDRYISRAYSDINGQLRDVPVYDRDGNQRDYDPRTQHWIDGMDSIFADGHTADAEGITVFRGVDMDWPDDIKVGDTYQDDGFISTTINRKQVTNFTSQGGYTVPKSKDATPRKSKGVEMTIKTKDDTKVFGTGEGHQELVLNRGTDIKIRKIEHCPDGICRVDAEIV